MATDLGKVGMRARGDWSSSVTYEVMDAVSYNNGLYIAKQNVPENTAPPNTTYWQVAFSNEYSGFDASVDLSPYSSASNQYTIPKDGYIKLTVNSNSASNAAILLINNSLEEDYMLPQLNQGNLSKLLYINKGLKVHCTLIGSATAYFYGLKA